MLSLVNIALVCQKPTLSKSSAVLRSLQARVWEKRETTSCFWVLGKQSSSRKVWHLMLGIVFNSTLGQRSQSRKCWNSLEAVTVLTAKDRPHGCWPSSHPTDMWSAYPEWHYTIKPRFSLGLLSIIQVFQGQKYNICLIIYCTFLTEDM